MTKREYGQGGLTERGDGKWLLRWYDPPDPLTGTRARRSKVFAGSKKSANAELARLQSTSRPTVRSRTLGQTIEQWRADTRHEPGTAANYERAVTYLPRRLIEMPVGDITAAEVRAVVKSTAGVGGVHRARLVHALLSGGLGYAWRMEWTPENVARRVQPPSAPERQPTDPNIAEVLALMKIIEADTQLYAWLRLSTVAGGRPGEMRALRWADVDLDRGQVRIDGAIDPTDRTRRKDVKNHASRTVAIGVGTVDALRRWHRKAGERAEPVGGIPASAYVFSLDVDGARPFGRDYVSKRFGQLASSAKLRSGVRLYDLRHFMATHLIAQGSDVKTVQSRIGHRRQATTTDTYAHAVPANDRAVADAMDVALDGVPAKRRRRTVVVSSRRAVA